MKLKDVVFVKVKMYKTLNVHIMDVKFKWMHNVLKNNIANIILMNYFVENIVILIK